MSEPEVVTKAPESDAAEASTASIVPGDTPAQAGASMGGLGVSKPSIRSFDRNVANPSKEHCVKDRPTRQYFHTLLEGNATSKTACADLKQLLE